MQVLAERLSTETGVAVETIRADLTVAHDLARIETRLRDDDQIGILVNNAGSNVGGGFIEQSIDDVSIIINLNATVVARLAHAVAHRFSRTGSGAIINVGSVVGLVPEFGMTAYGATKAFVLFLSQSLSTELGPKGVYVQAVLPSATRTDIWAKTGVDVNSLPAVMEVGELVDAAMVGFDRREVVTIPPLPDEAQWSNLEAARIAMIPNYVQAHAGARYQLASR
jgi:short-subunit dehydrogenase